jgi:DNA-binding MarR family transcriptional regulator/GNAT superfamily N-acetyltransferase
MIKLDSDILREIGAISRSIQTINDLKFRQFNLDRGQFVFLTRICEHEGINPIDLSNMLKVDKATTTKAIQKMEHKGLIGRVRDPSDKRMWRLYPKPEARDLYRAVMEEENENIAICFSGFSEKEKELAGELVKRMAQNIESKWESLKNGPHRTMNMEGVTHMGNLVIREYIPAYQQDIIAMILQIQQTEYNLPIAIKDQPDLLDIENFYQSRGEFWTALDGNIVVGTVGIIDIGNGNAVLRKMFVKREYRGKDLGVAAKLLAQLLKWAAQNHFNKIYLGTTPQFLAAHRFYEKNNFTEIREDELPINFPVMAVDKKFYRYDVE